MTPSGWFLVLRCTLWSILNATTAEGWEKSALQFSITSCPSRLIDVWILENIQQRINATKKFLSFAVMYAALWNRGRLGNFWITVPPWKVRALLSVHWCRLPDTTPHKQDTSSFVWFHGDQERGNTTDARSLFRHSRKSLSRVNNWRFLQDSATGLWSSIAKIQPFRSLTFPVTVMPFYLLGQIFHIVAPLADNKSDEKGSPSACIAPTHSAARRLKALAS